VAGLCESLPPHLDAALLGLVYLRAADGDVADLAKRMARVMTDRKIDTPRRQAHFLAQIGHESGELRFRAEIASGEAYEGRRDLGNTQPGDGRRFKGRGLIQLTGRANYREYGRAIGREADILVHPELLETDPDLCVDVAGWFWAKRNLNTLADADDLTGITKRINGGLNGLEDRRRLLKRAKALLSL
jgi:predicted chitinase